LRFSTLDRTPHRDVDNGKQALLVRHEIDLTINRRKVFTDVATDIVF